MGCASNPLECSLWCCFPWCSSAGFELNSWGCVLDPLEFSYTVELFGVMPCSWDQAELMLLHLKSSRAQLRCGLVLMMPPSRFRTELMGMCIKSIRIHPRSEMYCVYTLQQYSSWTHGDVFWIHLNSMMPWLCLVWCSSAGFNLNSCRCAANPLELNYDVKLCLIMFFSNIRSGLMGMCFQSSWNQFCSELVCTILFSRVYV